MPTYQVRYYSKDEYYALVEAESADAARQIFEEQQEIRLAAFEHHRPLPNTEMVAHVEHDIFEVIDEDASAAAVASNDEELPW